MKRETIKIAVAMLLAMPAVAVLAAPDYESPPVLKAADVAPRGIPLKGDRYRVDDEVPTDGYLATFTLRTDFGTVPVRGPGALRLRVAEVDALVELEKMEASDVFVDALKNSASSMGHAMINVVTNPVEVAKGIPSGVGRFFERVGRQTKTAVQKIGDMSEDREPGAPRGAGPSTNGQNKAVAGGVATGRAVRDLLGYDEQRRNLAKALGVDPYSTNPILKKKLDDIAWAAFAGGLAVDVLASQVPGSMFITSSSTLTDWVYEKPPGDLKVWIDKSLREVGVDQDTIDLFIREKYWTLTTQTALVMALTKMDGVAGRPEVLHLAVTAENEDQTRFLAAGLSLLARQHESTPLKAIIEGKPIGVTHKDRLIATLPVDYVCWTARTDAFAHREDLLAHHPVAVVTGHFSPRARSEMQKAGWTVREGVPLAAAF